MHHEHIASGICYGFFLKEMLERQEKNEGNRDGIPDRGNSRRKNVVIVDEQPQRQSSSGCCGGGGS